MTLTIALHDLLKLLKIHNVIKILDGFTGANQEFFNLELFQAFYFFQRLFFCLNESIFGSRCEILVIHRICQLLLELVLQIRHALNFDQLADDLNFLNCLDRLLGVLLLFFQVRLVLLEQIYQFELDALWFGLLLLLIFKIYLN